MSKKYKHPRRNIVKFEIEDIHEATQPDPLPPVNKDLDKEVVVEGRPSRRWRGPGEEHTVKIWFLDRRTSGLLAAIRRWIFGKRGR